MFQWKRMSYMIILDLKIRWTGRQPFQRCRLEDQVNNYIAEFFFNINELLQWYLKIGHINLIFFIFLGDGPSQQNPRRGYDTRRTRRERTETTSIVEEHPVKKDMDMDDLLKNWKAQNKTKRNSWCHVIIL